MTEPSLFVSLIKLVVAAGLFISGAVLAALSAATAESSDTAGTVGGATIEHAKAVPPQSYRATSVAHLAKAARSFDGDIRHLPQTYVSKPPRPEREVPHPERRIYDGPAGATAAVAPTQATAANAPAPAVITSFDGLDFASWGDGHPPDTNGDVGPVYYIQTINAAIGIYNKTTGARVAAFRFDALMSQGHFGNVCDTDNYGDPVVLYDSFDDRWILTDFAFQVDAFGNVLNPPGAYQCFAVSKSGDPVNGGWNFYSFNTAGGLGDYPKLGVWPDGIYMSVNMFDYAASGNYQNARVYAFNKAQMYAGAANIQYVSFNAPAGEFTLLPSNARLQTGTPPAGSPAYFTSVWNYLNVIGVWKLHADWTNTAASTFTGPFNATASTSWSGPNTDFLVSSPANQLDTLYPRLMVQNQYSNIGGVESLWNSHTVSANAQNTQSALRYYEVQVTGGTVQGSPSQAFTYSPDTTLSRFMPSIAVDRAGNMAIGYSSTNSSSNPALRYAGRLSSDPVNTITQTEQVLFQGTGTQSGTCGTSTCTRWGDYSAMTLDPDGCTFWYTNEYYATTGLNDLTRVGAFKFSQCTPTVAGALQGTVTASNNTPIVGATVMLGNRAMATTDGNGHYLFNSVPAGTYPSVVATAGGFTASNPARVTIPDGTTVSQNFMLVPSPSSLCITDTTQSDFTAGANAGTDATTTPGDIRLGQTTTLDQQNTTLSGFAVSFSSTTWAGQTFTAAVSGMLTRVDLNLYCSGCIGTTPNLVVGVRATSSGLPTGSDLATATVPGFSTSSGSFFTATFASPAALTAGTQYALVIHPATNPSPGTYSLNRSQNSVYGGGTRVSSTNSGGTWSSLTTDIGFRTYITNANLSGTYTSVVKDANPAASQTVQWSPLSWNNTAPAGTSVRLQVAGSNNAGGPFNFIGPDGSSTTYFTGTPATFTLLNGYRYVQYRAYLTSSSATVTPILHDATVCYNRIQPTALAVAPATATYGSGVDLSATLTSGGAAVSGESIAFALNGASIGSAVTNGNGVASLLNVSLTGTNAGTYNTGVAASFAGDTPLTASSGSNSLTISKADQTITFGALAGATYGDPPMTLSATATSALPVAFSSNSPSVANVVGNTLGLNGAGVAAITASQSGNGNYNAAPVIDQPLTVATKALTITGLSAANKNYDGSDIATVTGTRALDGVIANDDVTLSGTPAAHFFDRHAGIGKSINVTGLTLAGTRASNYSLTPLSLTADIAASSVSVTADAKVKSKGAPDPTFTYTANGLFGDDALAGTLSRTGGESPGSYPINVGTLSGAPDYNLAFTPSTLVITGPIAAMDTVARASNSSQTAISSSTLLANDTRIAVDGSVRTDNLSIATVTAGAGNSVSLNATTILFQPTDPMGPDPLTFSYTVTDGAASDTAVVTVNVLPAVPLTLQIVSRTAATYDVASNTTSVTVNFVSVPSDSIGVDWSTDLLVWQTSGGHPTEETGALAVTFIAPGNQTSLWNAAMFFRATH